MKQLIDEFKLARKGIIGIIDSFPKGKREEPLFDKWSLKNLVSHLSGWAEYQIKTLNGFKSGIKLVVPDNLEDSINADLVGKKSSLSWDRIYREFLDSSQKLLDEYERIPNRLNTQRIYENRDTTPIQFIKIEISHYQKTHGPQIKKVLGELEMRNKTRE